jgi:hypothetical protein
MRALDGPPVDKMIDASTTKDTPNDPPEREPDADEATRRHFKPRHK